jgi:hypothetical protein
MDIYTVIFILFILGLAAAYYLLHRSEVRTKNKCKMTAYKLLEEKNPDPKKIKEAIRMLNLYGGRFRRDQEFEQLIKLLADLSDEIKGKDVVTEGKIRK